MSASAGPAGLTAPASPAAAAADRALQVSLYVPTFSELFDVLSSASSASPRSALLPVDRVSSFLAAHYASFLAPWSCYPAYSPSAALSASSRVGDSSHAELRSLLTAFASSNDLDLTAAAALLVAQLRSLASQPAAASAAALSVASLTAAYNSERSALLGCLACLFRIQLDPLHPYQPAAASLVSRWVKEGGEARLLATLRSHCANSGWGQLADQRVAEQALMLQVLFLLYYDLDADYSALAASSLPQRVNEILQLLADTGALSRQGSYLALSDVGRQQVSWLRVLSVLLVVEVLLIGRLRVILDHPVFQLLEDAAMDQWRDWPPSQRDRRRQEVSDLMTDAQKEFDTHIFSDDTFLAQVDSMLFAPGSLLAQPIIQLAWAVLLALLVEYQEDLSSLQALYSLSLSSPLSSSNVLTRDHLLLRLSTALSGPVSPFAALTQQLRALTEHRSLLRPDSSDPHVSGYKEIMHELLSALCSSSLYGVLEGAREELCRMFALVMDGDNDLTYRFWEQDQLAALDKPLVNDALNAFPARLTLLPLLTALSGQREARRQRVREDGLRDDEAGAPEADSRAMRDATVCATQSFRTLLSLQTYTTSAEPSDYYSSKATTASAAGWTLVSTQQTVSADGVVIPTGVYGRPLPGDLREARRQRVREDGLRDDEAGAPEADSRAMRDATVCATQSFRTLLSLQTYTTSAEPSDYYSSKATTASAAGWTLVSTQQTVSADGVVIPTGVYGRPLPGDLVQWRVQWSGWHMLLNRLDRHLSQRCSQGDDAWSDVSATLRLIARLVSTHGELFRELQMHALDAFTEPIDITGLMLRLLMLLPSAESWAPRKDESALMDVLTAAVDVLTASLQVDLIHFTRVFTATLSNSTTVSALLSSSSSTFSSRSSSSSSSQSCAAFLQLVQSLHSSIERVHGSYPLTTFLCRVAHAWTPHCQLSLLHISRPASIRSFTIAMSSPSSSSTFSTFAALDVQMLLASIASSILPSSPHWRYQQPSDHPRLISAALQAVLVAIGHALAIAAQVEQRVADTSGMRAQVAAWLTERSGRDGLLTALVDAVTSIETLWKSRRLQEAALREDVVLQALYVMTQLLKMEKSTATAAAASPLSAAALASSFHSAMWQPVAVQHRSSAGQLLAAFTASSVQPHTPLQAVVLLLAPTFTTEVHLTALRTLILVATPLAPNSSLNLAGHLAPVLDVLRASLNLLAQPRAPTACSELVYQLMAVVLSTDSALAELLLIEELQSAVDRAERGMPATFSPITRSLIAPLQQSSASWHTSQPALLSSIIQLLAALWSNPTAALQAALIRPLSEELDVWQLVRDVLEQPLPSAPLDEQLLEAKQSVSADEDDQPASADAVDGESVQVPPAALRHGHRLSMRIYALQLLAMECYYSDQLPESVSSYLAAVDSVALLSSSTRCDDDATLRAQCIAWAEQLRIDLQAIENPQQSVSTEEDNRGHYLLEVAHRLLFDDLIAAARQESFLVQRSASPSPLAYFSHQPGAALPPPTGGTALAVVGQPSLEAQRDVMTRFLAALSRLNAIDHITARQTLLARSYHSFMQAALSKQPSTFLPPSSVFAFPLIQSLAAALSTPQAHSRSVAVRAVQLDLAGLLSAVLHYFLSSSASSSRSKQLMSSIVAASAGPDSTTYDQLRLAHGGLCGLLEAVLDALMAVTRRAMPPSAVQSLRSSVREVHHTCEARDRLLVGRWLALLEHEGEDEQRQPSSVETDDAVDVVESLLLSVALLLRYSSHLRAVHSVLRSRSASSSRSAASRALDLSAAPSRSARAITFTSPQPPPSAGKNGTSPLSPVVENADEDAKAADSAADSLYVQASSITQCLLLIAAAGVSHLQLGRASVALAAIALQAINEAAHNAQQSRPQLVFATNDATMTVVSQHPAAGEVLNVSVRCLSSSALSQLIYRFMMLPVSAASEAHSILRFLSVVAATRVGAAALHSCSILLHICQHPIFNAPVNQSSADNSPSFSSELPSFSPYLATGERDPWHAVWVLTVCFVHALLRSLSVPGQSPSFLSSSLQFLLVYRLRLQFVLQRRRQRPLTIGHLQEVEAVVRYVSLTGRLLAAKQPLSPEEDELLAEARALTSSLTDEYVRLLMDSRLLEERSVAVSAAERAMAADDEKEAAAAEQKGASSKNEQGESKEDKGEDKQPEKKLWRPLGSASKKGSSAASASASSPLRSPTKSSSMSSPPLLRRASGSGSVMEDSAERVSGRKRPVILTQPPALQAASFLLRSPMVAGMRRGGGGGEGPTDSVFDAWSSAATSHVAEQRGFAFFVHAIEYALCRILRDCFALLRVLSSLNVAQPATRALFNYRTKVFDAQPLVGAAPLRYADDMSDRDATDLDDNSDDEYRDLIDTEQPFDTRTTAAGQLARSLLASSPFLPSANYRPALSVLIDFSRYCLHLLNRLTAISPLLHQEAARQRAQARLAALATPPHFALGTPTLPSMGALLALLHALLESSLVILVQQADRHIGRLMALFAHFNQYAIKYRQQVRQQMQHQQQQYANRLSLAAFPFAQSPAPASPSLPVHPAAVAATRLHVALDGYRDRLLVLADELTRYASARTGVQLERRRSSVHSPMSPKSGGGGGGGGGAGLGGVSGGSAPSWSVASSMVDGAGGSVPNQLVLRLRERMYEMVAAELDGHDRDWMASQ